jgi:hypothetical protein
MKNSRFTQMIICLVIGIILAIWVSIEYLNFPGMREIRRAAFRELWWKELIAISFLVAAYILTFAKKK